VYGELLEGAGVLQLHALTVQALHNVSTVQSGQHRTFRG
jgi:hypothetical protein